MENISKHARAKNFGAWLILFGATLYLAACGKPSGANASQTTDPRSSVPAVVAATSPEATGTSLPIEQGIYGDVEEGGCAGTSRIFFYDGSDYGLVRQTDPEGAARASATVYRIERVGSFAPGDMVPPDNLRNFEGFAKVWSAELGSPDEYGNVVIEFVGMKATGTGRFVRRLGGHGTATGKFGRFDETYQKCSFSQLSPPMQATIRAARPQLAGGAKASRPSAPAQTGFPPIPKGYYAVGTTCARAANAEAASDGPSSLARFDESALTWFDGGPQIQGFEPLGNKRFRVRARSYGNGDDDKGTSADFVIRVTGASTFVTEPGSFLFDRQENFTHCPTNSVPKAVRDWFEG